ncbi:MAG: hypothetical protein MK095_08915 [Phycisphaerales bacterium]|nr:hypothetical protein [Phycisphaerales bacterium]
MRGKEATSSPPSAADDSSGSFDQPFILITVRLIYISLMIAAAVLPFAGIIGSAYISHQGLDILAPILATIAVATIIVLLDLKTPRKQLSLVVAVYLALLAGLLAAIAIGALIDLIAATWNLPQGDMALKYLTLLKLATGLTFCYLAVSMVLTTRDNIRLVIPYVEFAKQVRGIRPMLIDTSVLVDGRINMFCRTGFLDAPLVVPRFVIDELHRLGDSNDRTKRARSRRGLENLRTLQDAPTAALSIEEAIAEEGHVDQALIDLAAQQNLRLVTTDQTLQRVADIRNVLTLNLNDLSTMLHGRVVPGERLQVEILRQGDNESQGVGFLPDGTMVVVENAVHHIGEHLDIEVTNLLQTNSGRLVFATIADEAHQQH